MTKDVILDIYLNTVYFGKSCYGVQTASRMGQGCSGSVRGECASLSPLPTILPAMILSSAIGPWENNRTRQLLVLENMYKQGMIKEKEDYEAACNEEVVFYQRL